MLFFARGSYKLWAYSTTSIVTNYGRTWFGQRSSKTVSDGKQARVGVAGQGKFHPTLMWGISTFVGWVVPRRGSGQGTKKLPCF